MRVNNHYGGRRHRGCGRCLVFVGKKNENANIERGKRPYKRRRERRYWIHSVVGKTRTGWISPSNSGTSTWFRPLSSILMAATCLIKKKILSYGLDQPFAIHLVYIYLYIYANFPRDQTARCHWLTPCWRFVATRVSASIGAYNSGKLTL